MNKSTWYWCEVYDEAGNTIDTFYRPGWSEDDVINQLEDEGWESFYVEEVG